MNIMELAKEYIALHDLRSSSCKTYISSTNRFVLKFGERPLKDITNRDVLLWRKELLNDGLQKKELEYLLITPAHNF